MPSGVVEGKDVGFILGCRSVDDTIATEGSEGMRFVKDWFA